MCFSIDESLSKDPSAVPQDDSFHWRLRGLLGVQHDLKQQQAHRGEDDVVGYQQLDPEVGVAVAGEELEIFKPRSGRALPC